MGTPASTVGCPKDTNGDGDCGRPLCPYCGRLQIARQWCLLHNIHQDDPNHEYRYPDCERRLRPSTPAEDKALVGF